MVSDIHLSRAQFFDVIGIGWSTPVAFLLGLPCLQFHFPNFVRDQRRAHPKIVGLLGQQMPAENRELARQRDGCDLMSTLCTNPNKEGMQRPWRLRGCPCSLDQHGSSMAAPNLADASMMSGAKT